MTLHFVAGRLGGSTAMVEMQLILERIAALRQRLHKDPEPPGSMPGMGTLLRQIVAGEDCDARLEAAIQPLATAARDFSPLPRQLTSRARRVLQTGRDLLGRLRGLADAFLQQGDQATLVAEDHPLAHYFRATMMMTDAVLRFVLLMPELASLQLRLSEGLEATLQDVTRRVRILEAAVNERKVETERVNRLTELLGALAAGRTAGLLAFRELAEEECNDIRNGKPLRFVTSDAAEPARFVACHGLTTARVMARLARHDAELSGRLPDLVLVGLVHDAGMAQVPAEILAQQGSLDDAQHRLVERHCYAGAELLAPLAPDLPWLAEAARLHHERLDGTGYPDGLRDGNLSPLVRLLAVCDVYAACCSGRPHRPALETRTALADTLLLADQGLLDRHYAENLLRLSFYPVGQAVELADGSVGVVVAPGSGRDLNTLARPTIALLRNSAGQPEPLPRYLDLGLCDTHAIVRALSEDERRAALGDEHVEWAAA